MNNVLCFESDTLDLDQHSPLPTFRAWKNQNSSPLKGSPGNTSPPLPPSVFKIMNSHKRTGWTSFIHLPSIFALRQKESVERKGEVQTWSNITENRYWSPWTTLHRTRLNNGRGWVQAVPTLADEEGKWLSSVLPRPTKHWATSGQ